MGEEIILREGSNLKGTRGLMPLSAHLMINYLDAIEESKQKYASDHNIEKSEDKIAENTEDLSEEKNETKNELMSGESTEEKAEEKTEDISGVTTTVEPNGMIVDENPTSEVETILEKPAMEETIVPSIKPALVDVPILL